MSNDRPARYRLTFAVLALGLIVFALLQSMVAPLLPVLQHDLGTTQNTVTWVLTAYLLSASVATPILGRFGDKYGKENMLLVTLCALGLGCLLAVFATSIAMMIAARAIQGIGGAIMPLSFGIVRDEFPRDRVAGVIGMLAALLGVGVAIGVVIAGPLDGALGYRWVFGLAGIVVAIAFVLTFAFIPESPVRTAGRIGVLPAVLLSAWLVSLLLGFSQVNNWGWTSWQVLTLLIGGVGLAVAWVFAELASQHPLIDMRMMALPAVWTTNSVAFLVGAGLYTMSVFLPEYMQTPTSTGYGLGATVTESGLLMVPQAVGIFISASLSGPLITRFGGKRAMVGACALACVGFVWLALAHDGAIELVFGTALMSLGFGLAYAGMTTIVVEAVPAHQTGAASGMNANIRTVGGAIGAAVVSTVVTADLQPSGFPEESGYTQSFVLLAACMVAAAALAMLIPRVRHRDDPHTVEQLEMSHPAMAPVAAATIVGDESE
jgi:EmrB/QacA subfamily drug resistance transporter